MATISLIDRITVNTKDNRNLETARYMGRLASAVLPASRSFDDYTTYLSNLYGASANSSVMERMANRDILVSHPLSMLGTFSGSNIPLSDVNDINGIEITVYLNSNPNCLYGTQAAANGGSYFELVGDVSLRINNNFSCFITTGIPIPSAFGAGGENFLGTGVSFQNNYNNKGFNIAFNYGLQLINDNCHALGATYNNSKKYSTKYADVVIQSYHPVKNITTGEGGAILTNNKNIHKKIINLRSHGMIKEKRKLLKNDGDWYYEMHELGYNFRISDIQCALGISQLNKLNYFILISIHIL